jgi:hypothetical protein
VRKMRAARNISSSIRRIIDRGGRRVARLAGGAKEWEGGASADGGRGRVSHQQR